MRQVGLTLLVVLAALLGPGCRDGRKVDTAPMVSATSRLGSAEYALAYQAGDGDSDKAIHKAQEEVRKQPDQAGAYGSACVG